MRRLALNFALNLLILTLLACPRKPPETAQTASPCPDAPYGRVQGRGICTDCRGVIHHDADGGGIPPGEPCRKGRK